MPLAGFERSDSIRGDNLRHVVTFNGKKDVASLAGRPVTLRFDMKSAELFAFAFRQ